MRQIAEELDSNGFTAVSDVFSPDDLQAVRVLLDPLFARLDRLPKSQVRELVRQCSPELSSGVSPEINRPTLLAPELRETVVFRTCERLSRALLGRRASYVFDHAIYKAPGTANGTRWHQDEIYGSLSGALMSLHCWIPLQRVTKENGCMRFIPGSHRQGVVQHASVERKPVFFVESVDEEMATYCPLEAGGMTIHTPRTLHATSCNQSSEIRRAWILHFGPYGRWAKLHPRALLNRLRA